MPSAICQNNKVWPSSSHFGCKASSRKIRPSIICWLCSLVSIPTSCDNDVPFLTLFGSSEAESIPTNEMHNVYLRFSTVQQQDWFGEGTRSTLNQLWQQISNLESRLFLPKLILWCYQFDVLGGINTNTVGSRTKRWEKLKFW